MITFYLQIELYLVKRLLFLKGFENLTRHSLILKNVSLYELSNKISPDGEKTFL